MIDFRRKRRYEDALKEMRPCVKRAFLEGVRSGDEFESMRYGIVADLKRSGFSRSEIQDAMLDWNLRCERPLVGKLVKEEFGKFVDWCMRRELHPSCARLESHCVGQGGCWYVEEALEIRERAAEHPLPFDILALEKYLAERYPSRVAYLIAVVRILRVIQVKELTGFVICRGVRDMAQRINLKDGYKMTHKDVWVAVKILVREGVLRVAVKGKSGPYSKRANGYTWLPWRPPAHTRHTSQRQASQTLPICVPLSRVPNTILCSHRPIPLNGPICFPDDEKVGALVEEIIAYIGRYCEKEVETDANEGKGWDATPKGRGTGDERSCG